MTDALLAGVGVLITRPHRQAEELVHAVEQHGGQAIRFPTIEINARDAADVRAAAAALPDPDIVIFVSSNAVRHGLPYASSAQLAAVGPATSATIEVAGRTVDIHPTAGFDSEHLLAEAGLEQVAGKSIRIVRGQDGRELLATTLRERGARVDYLTVYDRSIPHYSAAELDSLATQWRSGDINVVVVTSVVSLDNLLALLPGPCLNLLARTPLVTPAKRVLKEALNQFPDIPAILAEESHADGIIHTISTMGNQHPDKPDEQEGQERRDRPTG